MKAVPKGCCLTPKVPIMTGEILPHDALVQLRSIGDPDLSSVLAKRKGDGGFGDRVAFRGLHGATEKLPKKVITLAGEVERAVSPDLTMLRTAQQLFGRFALEISGALLLAALPQSYATTYGARVLVDSGGLDQDLVRRVRRTAQFLLIVMQPAKDENEARLQWIPSAEPPDPHGSTPRPWLLCTTLRLYHQRIRDRLGDKWSPRFDGRPLNQEDLLGMLLTFSVSVMEVLERYGICWTADEHEAYLHLWDVIGGYLGIGSAGVVEELKPTLDKHKIIVDTWHGLRPASMIETRILLEQIRERQWADPESKAQGDGGGATSETTSLREGRLLTSSLLDELAKAMPSTLRLLPVTMMRTLAPDLVRDRLALGHNGVILRALGQLPRRRHVIDRFTSVQMPNRVSARLLRTLANDVTSRATVQFLHDPTFMIPGQEDWSSEFGLSS